MTIDLAEFEKRVEVRGLKREDYDALVAVQKRCFPGMKPWSVEQFESQLRIFPEGQICVLVDGRLVASSSSLIVDYDLYSDWHDWKTISDAGFIRNHAPDGDMLYGVEIMVDPDFRSMKLARRLYEARKRIVRERNLKGIVIGGRIPGYAAQSDLMTADEYVEKVQSKDLYDPVLTTQLANGFELRQLIPEYLPSDEDSAGFATHMEWTNVDYRSSKKRSVRPVQIVRLAAVQYRMRAIRSFDEFAQQAAFFVDAASEFKSDFVCFPALVTTQLLSFCEERRPGDAARWLAGFTSQYLELMTGLAIRHHVNIVGGSHLVLEEGKLFNVAFLFRRDGTIARQYKLHASPAERRWWGVRGGDRVEVFESDCGRVAVLVGYDVEFPELARIATKKGAQILFCPFNTSERLSYLRVRHCAQARCIENHVYAVLSGCTGNLPFALNVDTHYAQSCILTPADIPFSRDGVAAETTPNVETVVMKDLDVELLRRHRYEGTTRNWMDRRRDLYAVRFREDGNDQEV